ncbi:MAG: tetratricopeptide repeat protein [Myxococcaceae bacterium]
MSDPKVEVEKELGDIRREVIESRNLVIKTDNLLKNLHAELKLVGKRQEDFQKRQWISSGVAYVLFAALCITGAVMIASAQTASATAQRTQLEKSENELKTRLAEQKAEVDANTAAVRSAGDVYRMMTALPGDERLKGIDALVKLDTSRLSQLEKQALNDRATALRKEIGNSSFERGKAAFRRNEFAVTANELSRFLAMNPEEQDALDASFFLGVAYHQLRKHDLALPLLQRFVTNDRKSKTRDYAMLLLAGSYEASSQPEKAVEIAREALGSYPNSEFTNHLKVRLSSAKKAVAASGAAQADAAAPGAAQPPPTSVAVGAPASPATPPGTTAQAPQPPKPAAVPAPKPGQ